MPDVRTAAQDIRERSRPCAALRSILRPVALVILGRLSRGVNFCTGACSELAEVPHVGELAASAAVSRTLLEPLGPWRGTLPRGCDRLGWVSFIQGANLCRLRPRWLLEHTRCPIGTGDLV